MHKFNLIGGVLLIILCLAVFPHKSRENDIAAKGQLVQVEVLDKPGNCNVSASFRFMHFSYQGQKHSIKINHKMCEEIQVGRMTMLKHLKLYPDMFLMPNENNQLEKYSWIGLFILGCYAFVSSIYKLKSANSASRDVQ